MTLRAEHIGPTLTGERRCQVGATYRVHRIGDNGAVVIPRSTRTPIRPGSSRSFLRIKQRIRCLLYPPPQWTAPWLANSLSIWQANPGEQLELIATAAGAFAQCQAEAAYPAHD